jgi:hypothetical protein
MRLDTLRLKTTVILDAPLVLEESLCILEPKITSTAADDSDEEMGLQNTFEEICVLTCPVPT